jgi:hypothetical protein
MRISRRLVLAPVMLALMSGCVFGGDDTAGQGWNAHYRGDDSNVLLVFHNNYVGGSNVDTQCDLVKKSDGAGAQDSIGGKGYFDLTGQIACSSFMKIVTVSLEVRRESTGATWTQAVSCAPNTNPRGCAQIGSTWVYDCTICVGDFSIRYFYYIEALNQGNWSGPLGNCGLVTTTAISCGPYEHVITVDSGA